MGISGNGHRPVDPDDQGDETIVGATLEGDGDVDLGRTHSSEVPAFDPAVSHEVAIPRAARSPDSTGASSIPVFPDSEPRLAPEPPAELLAGEEEEPLDQTAEWRAPRRTNVSADLLGKMVAGRYVLRRVLGEGGMGTVYEAEHADLGKKVAIKVLAPIFDGHGEASARFLREAKAASIIESEHIAQVFDVGEDYHLGLYMVMELLRGDDLAGVLAQRGKLRPELAAGIAWQVCLALERAHEAGIAHRDLKPANVYLTRADDGSVKVKVLDFGIAKLLRDARSKSKPRGAPITRNGIVLGTPQYMSPEQAQGLSSIDHRTDVYSLGALLYECVAGVAPYPELESYELTMIKIVSEPAPRLSTLVPGVPAALDALVTEMMARDPGQRPPSAKIVRARLREVFPALAPRAPAIGGSAPSVPTPVPPRTGSGVIVDSTLGAPAARPRRTVPLGVAAGLAAATLVAMTAAALFVRLKTGTSESTLSSATLVVSATAPGAATSPAAAPAPPATGTTAIATEARQAADLVQRAQRALARGDAQDARDLAAEATRLSPGSGEAWITLGAAHEALGDVPSARAAYEACKAQAEDDRSRECAALLAR